jgi:hypothetical protein
MALGLGLAAVVGMAGSWWVIGRRKTRDRSEPPGGLVLAAVSGATVSGAMVSGATAAGAAPLPPPAATRRTRPPADWELASALDDAPIGTVTYEGGTDLPPDIEAALQAPVIHAEPGNARTRRMAEMHSWREETDRRSLLRRVGLPELAEDQ